MSLATANARARELPLRGLLHRRVRDVDGRVIGRITELHAGIELLPHGTEYVIRELCVRPSRWRKARYVIPWERFDFTDPARPVVRCQASELRAG